MILYTWTASHSSNIHGKTPTTYVPAFAVRDPLVEIHLWVMWVIDAGRVKYAWTEVNVKDPVCFTFRFRLSWGEHPNVKHLDSGFKSKNWWNLNLVDTGLIPSYCFLLLPSTANQIGVKLVLSFWALAPFVTEMKTPKGQSVWSLNLPKKWPHVFFS